MPTYAERLEELQRMRSQTRALEAQLEREARAMQPLTLQDEHRMVAAQTRADELYRSAGRLPAPQPDPGERPSQYERRLADGLKIYSDRWASANLQKVPDDAFEIVREQIYADATKSAKTHGLQETEIRELSSTSASGHRTREFVGGPEASFIKHFTRPARRAQFQAPEDYVRMMQTAAMQRVGEVVRTMRPPMTAPRGGF
jgi:hypothetical protein